MVNLIQNWKTFLLAGLEEDGFAFDWASRPISDDPATAKLISKSTGIWAADAGFRALEQLSQEMGMPITLKSRVKDGDRLASGQVISEWNGKAGAILAFERTFINLAAYCGGIATQTRTLVDQVEKSGLKNLPRITATRKTLPTFRKLAIQSTLIGGAHPHRFNLSGGLLLKENHIAKAGSISNAIQQARKVSPHLLKVEIEVKNLAELKEALQAGAEVIMLDNFSPSQVKEAISLKSPSVVFEVSGGIHESNLSSYLIEGLDVISVGSLTHSVKSIDLSLLVDLN